MAVFGDVGDALNAPGGEAMGGGLVGDGECAGGCGACTEEGLDEFGLAVAIDAGDAEDFTGADLEGDIVEVRGGEVLDLEGGRCGGGGSVLAEEGGEFDF